MGPLESATVKNIETKPPVPVPPYVLREDNTISA